MHQDPGWKRAAEILRRIASMQEGHGAPVASAASDPAPSSCASAERIPRESGLRDAAEDDYVRAVLDCYLWLPGTSTITSRHDRRCAQQLFRRGVALEVVKGAMLLAVARRTFRRGDPLPRVRALHFFLPVIEEVLECPCDPGYFQYLEGQLRPHAAQKARRDQVRGGRRATSFERGSPVPFVRHQSSRRRETRSRT